MLKNNKVKIYQLLPSDKEVNDWYDANIDESTATVSSSIYKFRLFLAERFDKIISPTIYNAGGFEYIEKKKID